MAKPLIVKCPCCGVKLDIDQRTGKVVRTLGDDDPNRDRFEDAFSTVKDRSKKGADAFDAVNAEVRDRQSKLDDAFQDAFKKVQETDDGSKPANPFDFD